jgi:glycosyltransferase involved in cell wall biosynthesis
VKHALLVTYYWPPAAGPGVHRWLRFSRYFKENGWQLTVYCPENGEWPVIDKGLIASVPDDLTIIRKPIFEPHRYLGKKNNPNKGGAFTTDKKPGWKQRFIMWVRGNVFIPDARMFWINPSSRFLVRYLKQHPEITTLITTGPPHSMHLIGKNVKRKTGIYWVADFRDPWTQIDFYDELMLGKRADNKHHKLEKQVLREADQIITVSNRCAEGLSQIAEKQVNVVTNGYDFPDFDPAEFPIDSQFCIAHFGSMPAARNPKVLWAALSELIHELPEVKNHLKIRLVGPVDQSVFDSIKQADLDMFLEHIPYVSHTESIALQRKTPVLLLVANDKGNVKGILTGKVFEYLGAKRFILAIGETEGDLAELIRHTQSGEILSGNDKARCLTILQKLFADYKEHKLSVSPKNLETYSSKNLAKKFISYLK